MLAAISVDVYLTDIVGTEKTAIDPNAVDGLGRCAISGDPHFSHALRRLHHRKRFHYLIKLTWQMASNLPDFERTSPAPPVGGVGGVGMWPCGVWFVGLRRRRGAARHAPGQTRADRDRPRRWRRGSGAR